MFRFLNRPIAVLWLLGLRVAAKKPLWCLNHFVFPAIFWDGKKLPLQERLRARQIDHARDSKNWRQTECGDLKKTRVESRESDLQTKSSHEPRGHRYRPYLQTLCNAKEN